MFSSVGTTMKIVPVLFILILADFGCSVKPWSSVPVELPSPPPTKKAPPPEQWFTQILDHFDSNNTKTWQQRYFFNDEFYKDGGPAFLYIEGESPLSPDWMVSSALLENAKKYHGLAMSLEHRFFGKSNPTEDQSTANLVAYLTVEQALADVANFVQSMNKKFNLTAGEKWVVYGGSYPGALAAWVRLKYPNLIHASVSSSAPALAIVDFSAKFNGTARAIKEFSEICYEAVHNGFKQLDELITTPDGRKQVISLFTMLETTDLTNASNNANFYIDIAGTFNGAVMYDLTSPLNRSLVCSIMENTTIGSEVDRLAYITRTLFGPNADFTYDTYIASLRNTTWKPDAYFDPRPWAYEMCNQLGYLYPSTTSQYLFSNKFPLEYFFQVCVDAFGAEFNETRTQSGVDRTNENYGGLNMDVERVVFVHGSVDPWQSIGIRNSTNPRAPSIYIEGGSHGSDLFGSSPHDPPALTKAREEISKLLGKWLLED